ncbi:unnamed protein product [Cyprideis torosa]|uniref:Exonuclease 1 n=1 Tax=Cyprideis torosa TaxID=163714 RepID=A0A7R8W237_9CRUS|nr:unnamed protein product [Cyprideis torosa]CAG0881557.1 unnamed protein product [Cyprideis torosa]
MGITGLLPFVKQSTRNVSIKTFAGSVVAVDIYSWLHKGAFACADEIGTGKETTVFVRYCMNRIEDLIKWGLKPTIVFDGRNLPSKSETELKRRENRQKYHQKARELLVEGKSSEAKEAFQRCIDVTPAMAHAVLEACRERGSLIDCIVAPYEADAQLAYLSRENYVQLVITEDSDLILFGCRQIMFKLDRSGNGVLYELKNLSASLGNHATSFTLDKFRRMCILSGCDYLASLPNIGLGKAFKFFSVTHQPDIKLCLKKLPYTLKMAGLVVSDDYIEKFIQADRTFMYQLVFDPREKRILPLTPYGPDVEDENLSYAGELLPQDVALRLALGELNVKTLKPWKSVPSEGRPGCKCFFEQPKFCIWNPEFEKGAKVFFNLTNATVPVTKRSLPARMPDIFPPAPKRKRMSLQTEISGSSSFAGNSEEKDEGEESLLTLYANRRTLSLQRISANKCSGSSSRITSYLEFKRSIFTKNCSNEASTQETDLLTETLLNDKHNQTEGTDVLSGFNPFAKQRVESKKPNAELPKVALPNSQRNSSISDALKQHGALWKLAVAKADEQKSSNALSSKIVKKSPFFSSGETNTLDVVVESPEKGRVFREESTATRKTKCSVERSSVLPVEKTLMMEERGVTSTLLKKRFAYDNNRKKSKAGSGLQTTLKDAFSFAIVRESTALSSSNGAAMSSEPSLQQKGRQTRLEEAFQFAVTDLGPEEILDQSVLKRRKTFSSTSSSLKDMFAFSNRKKSDI